MTDDAARFAARFAGLARGHGRYTPGPPAEAGTKVAGEARTIRSPATVELWTAHLAGTYGLGVIPITDAATCVFGAIDVDTYTGDLLAFAAAIDRLKLPLIVCRSKSGGAHLYVFTTDPVPAGLLRERLMDWAVSLGYSGVEVFPKQTKLANTNDYGNWINMPYYGALSPTGTMRYAVTQDKTLSAGEFLLLAEARAIDPAALRAWQVVDEDPSLRERWAEAPPCLQSLMRTGGIPSGQRNNGLLAVGVYLQKRHGDNWEEHFEQYNQLAMSEPLGTREVSSVKRSLSKKQYNYKCKDEPIVSCCNRQICLTRKFGVGRDGNDDTGLTFGSLEIMETVPPKWFWDVNGLRVELKTEELLNQHLFQRCIVERLRMIPRKIKQDAWEKLIGEKMQAAVTLAVPEETGPAGELWNNFETFAQRFYRQSATLEDVRDNNAVMLEGGRLAFSGPHFITYLKSVNVIISVQEAWKHLAERYGATQARKKMKSGCLRYWTLPDFGVQAAEVTSAGTQF